MAFPRRYFGELLRNLGVLLSAFVVMGVLSEIALRLCGFTPRAQNALTVATSSNGAPGIMESETERTATHLKDPRLGWRNAPGEYHLKEMGRDVTRRIRKDGSRATQVDGTTAHGEAVLLIGDSFTAGAGLSDEETFAWKLQQLLPDRRIFNFGVRGYGTCQVWAYLDELLRDGKVLGDSSQRATVVYGISDFHEGRTVGYPVWEYYNGLRNDSQISLYPFCGLTEGGAAHILPPRRDGVRFPGSTYSAFLAATERAYLAFFSHPFGNQGRPVTQQLLLQMKELVTARQGRFTVLFMSTPPDFKAQYSDFLRRHDIPFIDGSAQTSAPSMLLPDGHPNEALNGIWAEQLREFLADSRK